MPDICMCSNRKCKIRNSCYRFKAKPSQRQSYACFDVDYKSNKCEMYWPLEEKETKKK